MSSASTCHSRRLASGSRSPIGLVVTRRWCGSSRLNSRAISSCQAITGSGSTRPPITTSLKNSHAARAGLAPQRATQYLILRFISSRAVSSVQKSAIVAHGPPFSCAYALKRCRQPSRGELTLALAFSMHSMTWTPVSSHASNSRSTSQHARWLNRPGPRYPLGTSGGLSMANHHESIRSRMKSPLAFARRSICPMHLSVRLAGSGEPSRVVSNTLMPIG